MHHETKYFFEYTIVASGIHVLPNTTVSFNVFLHQINHLISNSSLKPSSRYITDRYKRVRLYFRFNSI